LRTKEAFGREGATMHADPDLCASRLQANMERKLPAMHAVTSGGNLPQL
jgi:hypothetical protein